MNSPKVLAIIPARGGSKGIPRKNIRPICGPAPDRLQHRGRIASQDGDACDRDDG